MVKFSKFSKLGKEKSEEIIIDLCEAIASTKTSQEAAKVLTDLLGNQELEMIAKRLRIAELLIDSYLYKDIVKELKTSPSTIARVQTWLQSSGEGYRLIVERTKKKRKAREPYNNQSMFSLKKRYPIYFWPQIMLENWVKSSTKKEELQMRKILQKLSTKTQTYKELSVLLNQGLKEKN